MKKEYNNKKKKGKCNTKIDCIKAFLIILNGGMYIFSSALFILG